MSNVAPCCEDTSKLSPEQRMLKSLDEREKRAKDDLEACATARKWLESHKGEIEGIAAAVKLGIFY